MEDDDEVTLNKKRTREEKEAEDRVSWFPKCIHYALRTCLQLLMPCCFVMLLLFSYDRNLEGITDVAHAMYQKKDTYVHISPGFADEIMSLKEVRRRARKGMNECHFLSLLFLT